MLQGLYEAGVTADLLVGTSAGAVNAAFISSRPQTAETALELERVWCSLRRQDIFPVSFRSVLGGLRTKRDHVVSDRGLRHVVRRHVHLDRLEDAVIPVHVVCFDLTSGREVLLSSGPAHDAIVASSSVPGILPPVWIGGRCLIDGGVVNHAPISQALALGAQRIYVLSTYDPSAGLLPAPRGALDAALQGLRLVVHNRLQADISRHAGSAELIVLPAPNPSHISPSDFDHAAELIEGSLAATRELLDEVSDARPDRLTAAG